MTTTRSSARRASGEASKDDGATSKKDAGRPKRTLDSPASRAKRGKTHDDKQQKSIEETMDLDDKNGNDHKEKNGDQKGEHDDAGSNDHVSS